MKKLSDETLMEVVDRVMEIGLDTDTIGPFIVALRKGYHVGVRKSDSGTFEGWVERYTDLTQIQI